VHKKPLPEPQELRIVKKTLVLDLDETLVHSSFVQVEDPDLKFDVNDIYIID
jgi:TFIIF-interacting CTD phosphatase-like protein